MTMNVHQSNICRYLKKDDIVQNLVHDEIEALEKHR